MIRKILVCLLSFIPAIAAAAPEYAQGGGGRNGPTGRAVMGFAPAGGRVTVPVTTTTTTNTYIPEVNETTESSATYNVDLDGARATCLGTYGNIWADKIFASIDGVLTSSSLTEAADPANNVCYSQVSVKSDEIKDMARFFPPRYFQTGATIKCAAWLDKASLDDAILDAKKNARIGGTIAAAFGGAVLGVGLTELIGRKTAAFDKLGYSGMDKMNDKQYIEAKLAVKEIKDKDRASFEEYKRDVDAWADACAGLPSGDPMLTSGECQHYEGIAELVDDVNND